MSLNRLLVIDYKAVGAFLREWREKAGLTQIQVSRRFKYDSAQFVSNWERGVSPIPRNKLFILLKMYKIPSRHVVEFLRKEQEKSLKRFIKLSRNAS